MAEWNIIDCDYDANDETINFGARPISDGDNFFEARTLATIKCANRELCESALKVQSYIKNQRLFYAVHKTLGVFTDSNCTEIYFNIAFEQSVNLFCVTPDAKYIFVSLQEGPVQVVDCTTKTLICEEKFLGVQLIACFIMNYSDPTLEFLAVSAAGDIIKIKVENAEEKQSMTWETIAQCFSSLKSAAYYDNSVILCGTEIISYNLSTGEEARGDADDIIKLLPFNKEMFLALDSHGNLSLICKESLIRFWLRNKQLFNNIMVVADYKRDSKTFSLVATTKEDETGTVYIQAFPSLTDFENPSFSIKINHLVHITCVERKEDDYIYISEVKKQDITSELRIQMIYETVPEKRLQRLLRRQAFDEAAKFAKLFNLDDTKIQKGRAQAIVDKLKCSSVDVKQLLEILITINDDQFKLKCCYEMLQCVEKLEDIQRVSEYCISALMEYDMEDTLHTKLSDLLFRFDLFLLLQRYNAFQGSLDWIQFSQLDLIELLHNLLQNRNIELAAVIYSHLDVNTVERLSTENIQRTLRIMQAKEMSLQLQEQFLHSFIPSSLRYMPTSISAFVKWLRAQIYKIEKADNANFPENAIAFTNRIAKLLVIDDPIVRLQMNSLCGDSLDDLTILIKALSILKILRERYQVFVTLEEYLSDTKSFVWKLLSIELSDHDFNVFFHEFLCKFIIENKFVMDDILVEQVKNLIQYEESEWGKVPRFLQHISSVDKKVELIHTLATTVDVPWSPLVRGIVTSALDYRHPLVATIATEIKNEPRNTVLTKVPYRLNRSSSVCASDDWEMWCNRIIYCNTRSMVEDIYTVCGETEARQIANFTLFKHFVKNGQFQEALKIIENISDEELGPFCQGIILYVSIFSQYNFRHIQNYPAVLKSVERQWDKRGVKRFCDAGLKTKFEILSSYFEIKTRILSTISFKDVENPTTRQALCDKLITTAVSDFQRSFDVEPLERCTEQIAKYLHLRKEDAVIKVVEKCGHFEVIQRCAQYIYLEESSSKNLCSIAIFILKSINPKVDLNLSSGNDDTLLEISTCESTSDDVGSYVANLELARKLSAKAVLNANHDEIMRCIQIYEWVANFTYVFNKPNALETVLSRQVYKSDSSIPSLGTFFALKSVLDVYTIYSHMYNSPNMNYISWIDYKYENPDEVSHTTFLSRISRAVHNLCLEGYILTAYNLITSILSGLFGTDIYPIVNTSLKKLLVELCIPQLLQRIFAEKIIDTQLAFTVLQLLDFKQLLNSLHGFLKLYRNDASKLFVIVQLILKAHSHYNQHPPKECLNSLLLSKWWMKIKNCQVPRKKFYTTDIKEVFELLIRYKHIDLTNVEEFCNDFKLNIERSYNIYFKNLITNWKPEYEIVQNADGKRNVIMKFGEEELIHECNKVVSLIEDKHLLLKYIDTFAHEINFYHYESFACLYKLLTAMNKNIDNTKKQQLLAFLKLYTRIKKPSDREIEEWCTMFPDSQTIDPLSQFRLPFTSTFFSNDIWNIIRSEINLKTYRVWFEAIPFLSNTLNKNDICSYVVKEVVSSGILQSSSMTDWALHPTHTNLFEELDQCIQNISDLERATSVTYHLMTHTPQGADQVNAGRLCIKYATEYKQCSYPQDPEIVNAFNKIYRKYLSYSIRHILHLCRLDVEQYKDIILQPDDLIDALYMNKQIIKQEGALGFNCPDVNKAVADIATLYDNIDIDKKRKELLENLLSNTSYHTHDLDDHYAVNLKYAAYICQSDDLSHWEHYLFEIGTNESDLHPTIYKANALKCLIMISDVETIENICDMSYTAFLNYIDKLYLLNDIEIRGFSMSLLKLNQCNKTNFLHRLSQDIQNPATVKIMGDLCMVYMIYDVKYWDRIIDRSIRLNMYVQLKKYVHFWSKVTNYKTRFYVNSWQYIINNSIRENANQEDISEQCVKTIQMIQSCPVLLALSFDKVFNKFCHLEKFDFAAILIQYMPSEKWDISINEILNNTNEIPDFTELVNLGIWGIEKVKTLFLHHRAASLDELAN